PPPASRPGPGVARRLGARCRSWPRPSRRAATTPSARCRRATAWPASTSPPPSTTRTSRSTCGWPTPISASAAVPRNTAIPARASARPASTRSSRTRPASACRSMPPTACTARPATSRIPTRSSTGCRRRAAPARTTRTFEPPPVKIALATAVAAFALDEDLAPLQAACAAIGLQAEPLAWDDPTVSWGRFDAVLLRSTWNYIECLPAFLAWCERIELTGRLWNPPEVLRWNTDKRYLADLAARGVPVVESHFLAPGDAPDGFPDLAEFVVKPCVGAGSRDARRFLRADRDAAVAHARSLLEAGRHVLVQPYLAEVDQHGETALMFFDGQFSHAIRKGPLLRRGELPTSALVKPERIRA